MPQASRGDESPRGCAFTPARTPAARALPATDRPGQQDPCKLPWPPGVGFHQYQLLTSSLLHSGFLHLAGNLVFLLVFGLRVNELIGSVWMAIVYPLLAVISGLAHHMADAGGPLTPMLGASGAIMGLAGMYFVLFPAQKVHMVIWLRFFLVFFGYKIFRMHGFWLLLLWVGLNDLLPVALGDWDGVAHWAHLGGFLGGMALAQLLLVTRQVNARGGDLLSVALGRHAWALIGKPRT